MTCRGRTQLLRSGSADPPSHASCDSQEFCFIVNTYIHLLSTIFGSWSISAMNHQQPVTLTKYLVFMKRQWYLSMSDTKTGKTQRFAIKKNFFLLGCWVQCVCVCVIGCQGKPYRVTFMSWASIQCMPLLQAHPGNDVKHQSIISDLNKDPTQLSER